MLNSSPSPVHPGNRMGLLLILAVIISLSCRQQPKAGTTAAPTPQVAVKNLLQMPPAVVGKSYYGTGVIVIINRKENWVEIDHEAIEGLMPAMQMEWPLKDKSHFDNIRVGDKVEFTVVETGKGEIITDIKSVSTAQ